MATPARVNKAMILAAGEGTRLRPLTLETPKSLLPVAGVPLVCHALAWLKMYGVSHIVMNLYHLSEKTEGFLGDGSHFGVEIVFSREEKLLGTAGGVKHVADRFNETFVVVYGDVLTDLDLGAMVNFHDTTGAMATVAVQRVEDASGKGVIDVDGETRIRSFVEKPTSGPGAPCLINAGIYVLEPDILRHVPQGFSDFGRDVFPRLLEMGVPVYAWRLRAWEYLIDIGTPEAYQRANEDIAEGKVNVAQSRVSR